MKSIKKIVKKLLLLIIVAALCFTSYLTYSGYSMYKEALERTPLNEKIATIKAQNGYLDFEEIPKTYSNALIAIEDHRFYTHPGIDIISITRAVYDDIKAMDFVSGGSTITQQLCKNIYFTQEKKLTRKVAEVFMAFKIEKKYSKEEILTLYINTCYFGSGYYGLQEASYGYFSKDPKDLSLYECSLLAGIPNAPSVYSLNINPDLANKRQKYVIDAMVKYGYLSGEEAANANQ